MRVLTEIGEIGVVNGDVTHVLRPSLYAMTQLGSPAEIVELYASVMGNGDFGDALAVIFACAEGDLGDLFGGYIPAKAGSGWRYKVGKAKPEHVIPLAQCLLKHGVTGAYKPLANKGGLPLRNVA